jgi:hypothetical protein
VDESTYSKIISQNYRQKIIEILQEGIEENHPMSSQMVIRHVMTAKEVRKGLEQAFGMSIKYPGLYFHLGKLEEHEIILIVAKIQKKKNYITYYGLSAKNYIQDPDWTRDGQDDDRGANRRENRILVYLRDKMKIDQQLSEQVMEELERVSQSKPLGFEQWLISLNLDETPDEEILLFLMNIYRYNHEHTTSINRLLHMLQGEDPEPNNGDNRIRQQGGE